jgi:hypothetical protein
MAWLELAENEYDPVWDRFYAQFSFRASVRPEDWPGIREPNPSVTFSIAAAYGRDPISFLSLERDLNLNALRAFRELVDVKQRLYALNWQHPSYWFFPHQDFRAEVSESWLVPTFPNGDYYIFLSEDFSFCWFGHPWEQTICICGERLIDIITHSPPRLFKKILRRNGQQI